MKIDKDSNSKNLDGGVKLLLRTKDNKFLIVLRGDYAQVWDFPGGGIDQGEDKQDAALREFQEEVGISLSSAGVEKISFIGEYTQLDKKPLYIFYSESILSSQELHEKIPENIYEISHGESREIKLASALEIFRMRENEVLKKEGDKIFWGSFKPFLKMLDSKERDESNLLRERFNENYSAYSFLDREKNNKDGEGPHIKLR